MFTFLTLLSTDTWHHDGPPFWPIFPLLWFAFIATVIFFVVRRGGRCGGRSGEARLAERFANGEIGVEEYHERRAVLRGKS